MSRSFVKLCQWKLYFSDTRWRSAPRCPQCFEAPSLLPEADLVSHRDDSFLLRAAGAAQSALTAGCSAEEERSLSLHCSCSVCLALGWLRESDGFFFPAEGRMSRAGGGEFVQLTKPKNKQGKKLFCTRGLLWAAAVTAAGEAPLRVTLERTSRLISFENSSILHLHDQILLFWLCN